jgi:hypothetical protein
MKHAGPKGSDGVSYPFYAIHEIYHGLPYNARKNGKKIGWTTNEIAPIGESRKEIIEILRMMLKDAKLNPVFEFGTGKVVERPPKHK